MSTLFKRLWIFFLLLACCLLIPPLSFIRGVWGLLTGKVHRTWEILQGLDRAGNAVLNGASHEYLSTRANRARKDGRLWGCYLCRFLDYLDPGHCEKSPDTIEYRQPR